MRVIQYMGAGANEAGLQTGEDVVQDFQEVLAAKTALEVQVDHEYIHAFSVGNYEYTSFRVSCSFCSHAPLGG